MLFKIRSMQQLWGKLIATIRARGISAIDSTASDVDDVLDTGMGVTLHSRHLQVPIQTHLEISVADSL